MASTSTNSTTSCDSSAGDIKRIGILTGGGDCPGLNAVIRAVTKTAIMNHGYEVFGIEDGFLGLVQNRITQLTGDSVSNILTVGGTILGSSNKCDPLHYYTGTDDDGKPIHKDVTDRCLDHIHHHHLDALVVIGGDGTMSVSKAFVEKGINCIGVPKTIDNDLVGTDITFGFQTAVETASWCIDRIHTTAASHHRVMVVEVMGRNAGWIALHTGVATGSDVILIPEIPFDYDVICGFVQDRQRRGKRSSIICIAEGATPKGGQQVVRELDPSSPDPVRLGGIGKVVADTIEECTGIETRTTVLGHIIRGGTPVHNDRLLGTRYGYHAVRLLSEGKRNRLVVMRNHSVTDVSILDAANKQRIVPLDDALIESARAVGTCFGDIPCCRKDR
ncbi:MAG: 6-phosphofructokinase [Planctomycetes bacterium]|nr:6-phosphofructokinase [Planctomycetota bacterium]NOG55025.1 6-phosphofructokinase [Planctomycetota bacterium]